MTMSVKNDMIQITPPAHVGVGNLKEIIKSSGHTCGYCHGNGFLWNEELRERVKIDCPVCNGSGKLDAVITIEWKPSKQ
jgi:DnaJ-class molecular chaperone